jgi:hypothetical protein
MLLDSSSAVRRYGDAPEAVGCFAKCVTIAGQSAVSLWSCSARFGHPIALRDIYLLFISAIGGPT